MRVLVVGAGIIGSIYGWALAESGHEVVHLVRSGRAAILRDGMKLDVFDRCKGEINGTSAACTNWAPSKRCRQPTPLNW